jgi:membrane protein implicated in regulation of membrane protease activity
MRRLGGLFTWMGGGVTRAVATGLITSLFLLAFAMTPGQAIAALWANPPFWLTTWWFRLIVIFVGLAIIAVSLWLPKWLQRNKNQLKQFYILSGEIIERTNSLVREAQASEEIDQFVKDVADWIGKNIGQAAKVRFLDLGPEGNWASSKLWNLKILRQNLARLIEKDDWQ